mmetsp:Transcript_1026/g.2608  ORF Transcript_1026/g.2608 Transcript_1026/m.2608 type:complete len:277 (+) Transcript_1026:924-1754(+)
MQCQGRTAGGRRRRRVGDGRRSRLAEPVPGQDGLGLAADQVANEVARQRRLLAVGHHGGRVGDGRVARHGGGDAYPVAGDFGIGAVDKAGLDLAAGHIVQHLAHVVGEHQLGAQRRPQLRTAQGLLGVAADGHGGHLADGDPAHLRFGQVGQAGHRGGSVGRRDQHQGVGGEVAPRVGRDELLVGGAVHRLLIGAGEDVGRRSLGDLLQQHARGCEIEAQLAARPAGLEAGRDLLERVRQAGGGGHRERLGRSEPRQRGEGQGDQQAFLHDGMRCR